MTKINKTLECIYSKMDMMNYFDTFGSIIMKNGAVFNVRTLFEYFNEYWTDYKSAVSTGDTKKVKEILKETGGVLSNDEISVDIKDIIATISVYKILENSEKQPQILPGHVGDTN